MALKVDRIYLVPFIQALLIHVLVFALVMFNWDMNRSTESKPQPRIIQAKMMAMADPIEARKKKEEQQRKAAANRAAEKKRKAKVKKKREQEQRKKAEAKRKAEQKRKADAKRKAQQKKQAADKKKLEEAKRIAAKKNKERELVKRLEREREQDFSQALNDESEYMQSQSDRGAIMSYVGLIQNRVIQNWHRPLSARNGMEVLLMIHLVPTGEVNNVYVLKGSGNDAFDRSAVQAVQRAEKFEELQKLSPSVFDANFRQFKMLFKPEDLMR